MMMEDVRELWGAVDMMRADVSKVLQAVEGMRAMLSERCEARLEMIRDLRKRQDELENAVIDIRSTEANTRVSQARLMAYMAILGAGVTIGMQLVGQWILQKFFMVQPTP